MPLVCVVGGGTAGVEAAREASTLGAEVIVLEKEPGPPLPWKDWPGLLTRKDSLGVPPCRRAPGAGGVAAEYGAEVESIRDGSATTAAGRRVGADSFVVATGSRFESMPFRGSRKERVWVLDSPSAHSSLGVYLDTVGTVVVAGEGRRGMQICQQVAGGGRDVTLLVSRWQEPPPSPPVFSALQGAARGWGVEIEEGTLDRAVGGAAAEAVLSAGRVMPCEALAVVPRRAPAPVSAGARTGANGGLLVDRWLRTGAPAVYGAGGCATLQGAPMRHPSSLTGRAASSGRVAGANAAGRPVALPPPGPWSDTLFGLCWWGTGTRPGQFLGNPTGVRVFCRHWGPESACSIAYDTRTGAILGAEGVAPAEGAPQIGAAEITATSTLHTLAYGSSASSDISVVSDTARLALARWQGS